MGGFSDTLRELQVSATGDDAADEATLFSLEPARIHEGRLVEPCVERFAYGELDPTRRLAASRNYLPGCPPSLAEKLGPKYARTSQDTRDQLKRAVCTAVAIGYFSALYPYPEVQPRRTSESIWEVWAPNCRDSLEDGGIPQDWAKTVTHTAADSFIVDLKRLGLTQLLGGVTLRILGMLYGQAGVWLRITQTMSAEGFDRLVGICVYDGRPRPYSAYPM